MLDDELYKVNSQLTTIPRTTTFLPAGSCWWLRRTRSTRANLLEVSENVKTWMESVSREAALTAIKKEVESLCLCLDQLSAGLAQEGGRQHGRRGTLQYRLSARVNPARASRPS